MTNDQLTTEVNTAPFLGVQAIQMTDYHRTVGQITVEATVTPYRRHFLGPRSTRIDRQMTRTSMKMDMTTAKEMSSTATIELGLLQEFPALDQGIKNGSIHIAIISFQLPQRYMNPDQ